jgi:branched-chain amino acid transport system substrate-binding protein
MNRTKGWAALAALALSAGAGAQEARDYYKIGVVCELSGDTVTGGNVCKRGYDLWAQEVNAQGGVQVGKKKYPVKLYYGDSQSNPSQGAAAAERLITQEHVDFMFGPYTSGCAIAVGPVVDKYKIPMINGSAESPMVWLQHFKYVFGTIPPVNFTGAAAMQTLAHLNPAPKTAVVFGSNDTFSKATATAFNNELEKLGVKVLKFNILPAGQELTPLLSAMKGLRPDIIAFGGHDEELIKLVKDLRQIDYTPKALIMHYGVTEPAFMDALKGDANQVFGGAVWTETMPTSSKILWKDSQAYAAAAKKAFGVAADYTQGGCSAAGIAFQEAVKAADTPPPLNEAARDKVVGTLEKLDVQTFYGRVKFATDGDYYHSNVGLNPLTVQIQGGKVVSVGPKKFAEAKAQYPMTPWANR